MAFPDLEETEAMALSLCRLRAAQMGENGKKQMTHQIVHERDPVSALERPDLVGAVRIECNEGWTVRGLLRLVEHDCPSAVFDRQLAASERGRKGHHESREHAGGLLRVAMRGEVAPGLVEEQLVELRESRHEGGDGASASEERASGFEQATAPATAVPRGTRPTRRGTKRPQRDQALASALTLLGD